MVRILKNRRVRGIVLQSAFLAVILGGLAAAVVIGHRNLQTRGLTTGFAFLDRATGFDVGFSLIPFDPGDTYARLIWVGILNTMFLGAIGIFLANLIGLAVAVFRSSENAALNALGTLYVETFRNIPLILQALFWYAVFTHLPHPREAYRLPGIYLSARGIYVPGLNVTGASAALFFLALGLGGIAILWVALAHRFRRLPQSQRRAVRWGLFALSLAAGTGALALGHIPGAPVVSLPHPGGLNIRDGIRIPPELAAMAVAVAAYGGAYIAEIIRAGFNAVGRGQVEAAQSLGLSPWHVFSRVRLPLAIRAVLPTLINQYVWLYKATTLGIAVGFTDLFFVVSVSINQAGQTLELIGILMAGFLVMNNTISLVLNRVNKAIALKGTQLRS